MRLRDITMAGIILLVLAFVISPVNAETDNATTETNRVDALAAGGDEDLLVDDIEPDESIIGPENALYRLKLAFEDLDVAFTFNESEKVGKQVSQARQRLAEIKAALKKNNLKAADTAIDRYREVTEKANESISKLTTKDGGLVRAQAMIAKHQYVLEGLIESHPNNTGLLRAHNNSERLLSKFALKTGIKLERKTDKMGRKMLKRVDVEDDEDDGKEKTQVKASVEDNRTHVKVELKFLTNSTEPADIAGDISDRVAAIKNNVSTITMTTTQAGTRTATLSREKVKADAEVKGNTTRVKFEYTFFLNATEDSAIITGVEGKLSALTADKIQGVLDVKAMDKRIEIKETKRNDTKKVEINEKKQENRNTRIDRER
ncbi:hypothetical protein ig2599ANME_0493 [groundwater metagenome]